MDLIFDLEITDCEYISAASLNNSLIINPVSFFKMVGAFAAQKLEPLGKYRLNSIRIVAGTKLSQSKNRLS